MGSSIIAPVVAGLAAGIAFVILFASLFSSAAPVVQSRFHADLSIDGLKDRYSVGESIDFTIRATGYGVACGYPDVEIIDLDRHGETVFGLPGSLILIICDLDANNFDRTWTLTELGTTGHVTIDRVGHYKVVASFGRQTAEKYFIVDEISKRAIEKTNGLDEVKTFVGHYPGAEARVYFVTTCATESCETLIRVPSVVEYLYEAGGAQDGDNRTAILRVGIEQKWNGEPVYFQISCQASGSEDAKDIYGSRIEEEDIVEFLHKESRCPQ